MNPLKKVANAALHAAIYFSFVGGLWLLGFLAVVHKNWYYAIGAVAVAFVGFVAGYAGIEGAFDGWGFK